MVKKEHYGDLYIPMNDVSEKRKNLLLSIKNSLIMQEEYEKILAIRSQKHDVLKTIRSGMSTLNSDFLKVKKFFPNVKNVLSNTEKEISELESQISILKSSSEKNLEDVEKLSEYENSLYEMGDLGIPKEKKKRKSGKRIQNAPIKKIPTKPLTKKERVKNNLKAIESKLKHL